MEEAIESLRRREEELQSRIQPIDDRLAQIAEQKSRLADDWVKLNIDPGKYRETQQSLHQEESRLRSLRSQVDPAQLAQLEETRNVLKFWETQSKYFNFNLEDDEGQMVRIGDMPHKTVLGLVGINSKEVSQVMQFPATRRELLNRLQLKVNVFYDRIEVNALFPVPSISSQKCTSP
jgi:DNA repair exonuclease SbcCD ATPase subunit